ncbi:MAG: response regulator [Nitrospirae bacterium]|nr:MAG: response regulator [Nitrospirota bacterium]
MENAKLALSVLYVEDDPETQKIIADILKRRFSELYLASNGSEGLLAYEQHRPDIVVTDIRMPEMGGIEMAGKIMEINNDARIILTTAHSDTEYLIDAINIGVGQYVLKPIDTNALITAMTKCARTLMLQKEREILIKQLQEALDTVKTLKGMIPICSSCKKIRDDKGFWEQIESYITEHTEAEFTHSICPECTKRIYPQFYDKIYGNDDRSGK